MTLCMPSILRCSCNCACSWGFHINNIHLYALCISECHGLVCCISPGSSNQQSSLLCDISSNKKQHSFTCFMKQKHHQNKIYQSWINGQHQQQKIKTKTKMKLHYRAKNVPMTFERAEVACYNKVGVLLINWNQ